MTVTKPQHRVETIRSGLAAVTLAGETIGYVRHHYEDREWSGQLIAGDVVVEDAWLSRHKTRAAAVDEIVAAYQAWAEVPDKPPVFAGDWGIDSKGRLWHRGEWIGWIRHDTDRDQDDERGLRRQYHAQGIEITRDDLLDRYASYSIGGTSAARMTMEQHEARRHG